MHNLNRNIFFQESSQRRMTQCVFKSCYQLSVHAQQGHSVVKHTHRHTINHTHTHIHTHTDTHTQWIPKGKWNRSGFSTRILIWLLKFGGFLRYYFCKHFLQGQKKGKKNEFHHFGMVYNHQKNPTDWCFTESVSPQNHPDFQLTGVSPWGCVIWRRKGCSLGHKKFEKGGGS